MDWSIALETQVANIIHDYIVKLQMVNWKTYSHSNKGEGYDN